ncbi:type II toxin-antitoxin system VapB family antitoxin [Phytomonospora sp. NPDC050363]|uniref:type II toxin-antitoxin system VapB family antitoxin n=1 Tax=Phytomonospora sp. NPDC050363 TaxID=3155642 RepID=UPI0033C58EB1
MARVRIDLDEELLAEAARALGTGTPSETVDAALREVLAHRWRALALVGFRERDRFDVLVDRQNAPPGSRG